MTGPKFVDYSGALPILLPARIAGSWHGFYVPTAPDTWSADLELPEGKYNICTDFDFTNPKTDYDRACALSGNPAVQKISVGAGHGLIFATELDSLTWWPERRMLVNGFSMPDASKLQSVNWSNELDWSTNDEEFLLINACDHGAAPRKDDSFEVHLPKGDYAVQWGQYGWAPNDPWLLLFCFVPKS